MCVDTFNRTITDSYVLNTLVTGKYQCLSYQDCLQNSVKTRINGITFKASNEIISGVAEQYA